MYSWFFREAHKTSTRKNKESSDIKNVSYGKGAGQISSADDGESIIVTRHKHSPSKYDQVTNTEDTFQHASEAGDGGLNILIEPSIKKNLTHYDQTKGISLIFKNCSGYNKFNRSSEFEELDKYNLIYLSETFSIKTLSNPWKMTRHMYQVPAERSKVNKQGRNIRGQLSFVDREIGFQLYKQSVHHQTFRNNATFIVGIYLQYGMLLEDKIAALVEILDDILNCVICDTKS